jgi:hypothetical protein
MWARLARLKPAKPVTLSRRRAWPYQPGLHAAQRQNYHAIIARAQYKLSKLLFSGGYRQKYNNNSVTLTTFSSRSRDYSVNAA